MRDAELATAIDNLSTEDALRLYIRLQEHKIGIRLNKAIRKNGSKKTGYSFETTEKEPAYERYNVIPDRASDVITFLAWYGENIEKLSPVKIVIFSEAHQHKTLAELRLDKSGTVDITEPGMLGHIDLDTLQHIEEDKVLRQPIKKMEGDRCEFLKLHMIYIYI